MYQETNKISATLLVWSTSRDSIEKEKEKIKRQYSFSKKVLPEWLNKVKQKNILRSESGDKTN